MVNGDDEKQVLAAKEHLLTLLDDPYYFEAYQRLFREKHPRLLGIKGRMPNKTGGLARNIQDGGSEPATAKRKGPGRPADALLQRLRIDEFRDRIDEIPGPSLKAKCRVFVECCRGGDDEEQNAAWTDWLYRKVRSSKRNN
jgi:hypothetical protein